MSILCSMVGASFAVAAAAEVVRLKKGVNANGNAQIDTAQSKFGGAAALFDGSGDYLTVSAGGFNVGTGNITVECWVRHNAINDQQVYWDLRSAGNSHLIFYIRSDNKLELYDGLTAYTSTATLAANTWYHLAVSRSGSSLKVYIDGVEAISATNSRNLSDNSVIIIGTDYTLTTGNTMNGWIDELRISNTARYTAAFTPSTSPFVNDDNTLLLLHMNGTDASTFFEDDNGSVPRSSRTAKTLTVQGNAQVDTAQSKFGGASYLGDGTGDYLVSAANTDYNFGTSSFTIEFWVRFAAVGTLYVPIAQRTSAGIGNGEWWCEVTASERKMYWGFKNQAGTQYYVNLALAGTAFAANTWYHIALVNNAGTAQMYIDGVATGATTSLAGSFGNSTTDLWVGAGAGAYSLNGHLDEVRISNTARYTAAFTPATAAFSNDANTLLLLHMDGADASTTFTDDNIPATRSQVGLWGTGSAALSTTQSKFGFSSLRTLSANVTKIAFSSQPLDTINTGPFTIEMWYRPDSVAQTTKVLLFTNEGGANRRGLIVNNQTVKYAIGGTDQITTGNLLTAANTWYHIALVRGVNNTTTLYVDGVSGGTYAGDTLSLASTGNNTIAALASGFTPDGYIDEFRISKTARYTSAFTPPTSAFTNDSDTVMLLHFDGAADQTIFRDDNGQTPPRIPKHISYYGNAQIDTAQSKFGGASALFDGNGDYLLLENQSSFAFTGDFTIEFWWYQPSNVAAGIYPTFIAMGALSSDGGWQVTSEPTTNKVSFITSPNGSSGMAVLATTNSITAASWHHIAVVRSSSVVKIYVDGTQSGSTYTTTGNPKATTGNVYIGGGLGGLSSGTFSSTSATVVNLNGSLDEIRVSDSARYTANFTPSTTPFVNDANTLLLLHADGVDATTIFVDDAGQRSQKPLVPTGNAEISATVKKVGNSSLLLSGSTQFLSTTPISWHAASTGTIEFYFYLNSTVPFAHGLFSQCTQSSANGMQVLIVSNKLYWYESAASGGQLIYDFTLSANTWYHVAVVKESSSTVKIYVDGTLRFTDSTSSGLTDSTSNFLLGRGLGISSSQYDATRYDLNGNLDEFRISTTARYTANFTPSTTPFQNDSNTVLLAHFDATGGTQFFFDDNGRDTTPAA